MEFKELKDIVNIYSCGKDGKPDREWDKAKVTIFNHAEQKSMNLVFTGSSKGDKPEDYKINFNVSYENEKTNDVFTAFENTVNRILPSTVDEQLKEYKKIFIEEILKLRNA